MTQTPIAEIEAKHLEIQGMCDRALAASVIAATAALELHETLTEAELIAPLKLSPDLTGWRRTYAAIAKLKIRAETVGAIPPDELRRAMILLSIVPRGDK